MDLTSIVKFHSSHQNIEGVKQLAFNPFLKADAYEFSNMMAVNIYASSQACA